MKKKLLALLLTLAAVVAGGTTVAMAAGESETVTFADENLRAAVVETLELSSDRVTRTDMARLTRLETPQSDPQKMITSLAGLEFAVKLVELNLDYNKITDLTPLSGLDKLESLNLSYNKELSDLSPLRELDLKKFYLTGVERVNDFSVVAGYGRLEVLNLALTNLDKVDFAAGLPLKKAYFSFNHISDVSPLSSVATLETLALDNNNVVDISTLDRLTNLTTLTLENNLITDFTAVLSMTKMESLNVSRNFITDEGAQALFDAFPDAAVRTGPALDESKNFRFYLNKSKLYLGPGESFTLVAKLYPEEASPDIRWTSSDPAVATVDGGVVTLVKGGRAVITAGWGDYTVSCEVALSTAVRQLSIAAPDKIKKGRTETLTVTVLPDYAVAKEVSIVSSDEGILTVEADGLTATLTAVKKGKAVVTVNVDGVEETVTVRVTDSLGLILGITIPLAVVLLGGGAALFILLRRKGKKV